MFRHITFLFIPEHNHPATLASSSITSIILFHLTTSSTPHLNIGKRSHDHKYHFPPKAQQAPQKGSSNSHLGHAVRVGEDGRRGPEAEPEVIQSANQSWLSSPAGVA